MSGFIKGIVVGLGSFGLGFVVLSVVLPVEGPGAVAPSAAQVEAERQAEVDLVPATAEPVVAEPAPGVSDPTLVPGAREPSIEAVPVTSVDAANLPIEPMVTAQEPEAEGVEDRPATEEAGLPEPVVEDPAPAPPSLEPDEVTPADGVAEPIEADVPPVDSEPVQGEAPVAELAEITAPQAETIPAEAATQAIPAAEPQPTPAAVAPVETDEPALEPAAAERVAGPSPDVLLAPAPETAPLTAGATDTPGAVTASAVDPTSLAEAGSVLDRARASLAPLERAATEGALPDTTAPAMPEAEPPAPPAAESVPQPAPEPTEATAPLAPVPAARVPLSEPLLPRAPGFVTERPPVLTLPTGTPQVAVRRGASAEAAPRQVEGVTVGRLARIGAPVLEAPATDPTPDVIDPSLPAAQRFAAQPAITGDERPLGVVLTDSAASETAILALPVPVTVALDPYDPDAPRRAAAYRAAGHEIALLAARMPALATPSDLTVILDAWMRDFPETVALMDVPLNGVGANPSLARDLSAMLAVDGYGAIALRDGLDAFLQAAQDSDVQAVPVYREIDSTEQSEVAIRRMIDRAAFEALRRPGILIAGSADDRGLMTELVDFAQGRGRGGVALAPASAVFITPR